MCEKGKYDQGNEWFITDDDCLQCYKVVIATTFEFVMARKYYVNSYRVARGRWDEAVCKVEEWTGLRLS